MTAGVYIVTIDTRQINPYLSGGALYVNLWHGNGLKACIWNSEKHARTRYGRSLAQIAASRYCRVALFYTYFRKPDLALSTSPFLTGHLFAPQFRIPPERFIETDYPRNAILFWEKDRILDFIRKYEPPATLELVQNIIPRYDRVYIYMPTWRDSNRDTVARSGIDPGRLNDALRRNNELFILKLHPLDTSAGHISGHSNIRILRANDVYAILPFTHTLVTDYSSVYYDFLLMNREIILFCFDLDEYLAESRELMFDYAEYTPGVRAENFDTLLALIENRTDCHVEEKQRDRIMKLFWESHGNGLDIVQTIKEKVQRFRNI
jgi:CDP-glycerol glycerophosphotransferase (TagB/SpsB family)